MGKLTGEEARKLAKMFSQTLDFPDLESFVYASTGDQLYDEFVAKDQPKRPMIEDLLKALERLDVTGNFLAYVYVNRPGNRDIRDEIVAHFPEAVAPFDKKIDLSAQTAGAPQANAARNAVAPGLQRNVRPYLKQLDVRIWQEKLLRIERRVCLVEIAGTPLGTGFLVGPDAALTNWHVFEAAKSAGKADQLGCRFDFVRLPNNTTQPGQVIAVDLAAEPDTSRYSEAEIKTLVKEADVQIYAIGIYESAGGRNRTPEETSGPALLTEIAEQTGGRQYQVDNLNELPDVASKIGVELRNQYILGYSPKNLTRDGKYRKVQVKLVQPHGMPVLRPFWKQGYYAPTQ